MSASQVGIIIILLLLLALLGGIFTAVRKMKRGMRSFARQFLGADSLKEGFDRVEQGYAATPKSVSAMTSLLLPRIKKDFPEFQYDEMKVRAQNVLTSYLLAVSEGDPGRLTEGSRELKDKLKMYLSQQRSRNETEQFQDIKLHRTEISDYRKQDGRCVITFQTSLQYRYSFTSPEDNPSQKKTGQLTQARYNTEAAYIQDRSLVGEEKEGALGLNCPNCGAPVSGLGHKVCEYCGTPIREINIYAWSFQDVRKA